MSKKIKMYTAPSCYQCKNLMEFYKKEGIEVDTIDIKNNKESIKELVSLGFSAVPVSVINGEYIYGSNMDDIKSALEKGESE